MSDHQIGLWRATYLLPYAENPMAKLDKNHPSMYRHVQMFSGETRAGVAKILRAKGAYSIEVVAAPQEHPLFNRVSSTYRAAFIQSLIFAVEGGLSPGRALENMILAETGAMRARFNTALDLLQGGNSFITVMRALNIFDMPTLAILEAGEESSQLKQALSSAYAHLTKSDGTKKLMFGAIIATSIDILFAAASVFGVRYGMLPKIKEDGPGAKATAEQIDQFNRILNVATWGNDLLLWFTLIVFVAVIWAAVIYMGRSESMRARIDTIVSRLPVIGALYIHSAVASTTAIMANLLKGGVGFIPACEITLRGTRLAFIQKYWSNAAAETQSGITVAKSLSHPPMNHLEQMVISSHQSSQQLAAALTEISKGRDELAKAAAKKFGIVAFLGSMLYSGLSVLMALAVVMAQSSSSMSGP